MMSFSAEPVCEVCGRGGGKLMSSEKEDEGPRKLGCDTRGSGEA